MWNRGPYGPDPSRGHAEFGDEWTAGRAVNVDPRKDHSSLKTVVEWTQQMSPAVLNRIRWESNLLEEKLRKLELRRDETVKLWVSLLDFLRSLVPANQDKWDAKQFAPIKEALLEAQQAVEARLQQAQRS